jgi:hypothetical protein
MLSNIEKGDIVVIKDPDGATKKVTVLAVKPDYEHPGAFIRFDYIDYGEASPMRRTAYPRELLSIVQKTASKALDPKAPRPGDSAPQGPQKAIVIDGKVYVERTPPTQGSIPVNEAVTTQVHEAVKSPNKPVESRIKKAPVAASK